MKLIRGIWLWIWRDMGRIRWTDKLRNKNIVERVREKRNIMETIRKKKKKWVGHWLRRWCLLVVVVEKLCGRQKGKRKNGISWCKIDVKDSRIIYLCVCKEEQNEKKFKSSFQFCQWIPGTREYNQVMICVWNLLSEVDMLSTYEQYDNLNISKIWISSLSLQRSDHVTCIYDNKWWIGKVFGMNENTVSLCKVSRSQ